MEKRDKKSKSAKEKQWEDKVNIAIDKAKLAEHKAEEKWDDFVENVEETAEKLSDDIREEAEDAKSEWDDLAANTHSIAKHISNVAKEKATEVKHTLDETIQKVKHRIDEKRKK